MFCPILASMVYDYDRLYGERRDALGAPTSTITAFFEQLDRKHARVLDVGCGQGRDAAFIARMGHGVVGVDLSPNGIRDLTATARSEGLNVEGIVADITLFVPDGLFDVVLFDRTLHMLPGPDRHRVLARLLDHVADRGWVLIADESRNIPDLQAVISGHPLQWTVAMRKRGYLFAHRA